MPNSRISKVNVCIPVYNGSPYIAESINSVLAQTYEDFHLIICDNCSTDNTEEIVRSFNDPRITFIRNEKNLGLVGNANRCIEHANGQYVNILHHDDIMLKDNLALKVRILDEHSNVGLVHSDVLLIDETGKTLDLIKFKDSKKDYIENGIQTFQRYIMNMPRGASFFIGAVLVRRDCYLQLGGYDPKLPNTNDSEMMMRIMLFYDAACIGMPLVKYRLHHMMTSTFINDDYGLNVNGLEEHYLASNTVINKYKNRIPQWKKLKNRVSRAFAMRAVEKVSWIYKDNRFALGIAFLKAALKIYPPILCRKATWAAIIKLMVKRVQYSFNGIFSALI
jgi:glycosyltransferase involved in cell wall biosynthesis